MVQLSISSEREKYLVITAAVLVVLYVFYTFLITPKLDESSRISGKLKAAQLDLKVAETKIKILESAKLPERIPAARAAELSPEEKALDTFKQISSATSKSGLTLDSIVPVPNQPAGTLRFSAVCSGRFRNLYLFLVQLGKLDTVVLAENLQISGGGVRSPELNIKMDLVAII